MIRFGQSTRWYIVGGGPDEEETATTDEAVQRKPLRIVSKKENEEFLFKRRVEQIKRMDEQMQQIKQENLKRLRGRDNDGEDGGISWGMGFEDEDAIAEY